MRAICGIAASSSSLSRSFARAVTQNGEVVAMKLVNETDNIMLMTEKGILIRTRVNEIRETGRGASA